ncbi:MAG: site-specific integrase [Alphaproteobacteria bacterium]|nr:MAG: site-specific integrase [Alphaproteobacteria bacterium]
MTRYNTKNERIKREYFRYLKDATGRATATIDGIRKAISRFEEYNRLKDFGTFNREQAIAFKDHLALQKAQRTGEPMAKATMLGTLNALKEFFRWLSCQPGYKSRLHRPDIEYLNMTDKDVAIAKAEKHKNFPTLQQIHKTLFLMPVETDIQRRDRAVMAFAILTGMRDNALASLRLRHVDTNSDPVLVRQEPDLVRTKFSKSILTHFFPVGDDIKAIALDWVRELREQMLYGPSDPVFPRTRMGHDENQSFTALGLEAVCWDTATAIRRIFKTAFEAAGLPYFHPHLFRHTLGHLGQKLCKTPEEFKAWSQNLGHENPLTTFTSYGKLDTYRQGTLINGLGRGEYVNPKNDIEDVINILRKLQK